MVVCHVKAGQGEKADGFLFESTVKATNAELIKELVEVWNLRVRVKMLVNSVRQLAEYGPMKPPNKQVRLRGRERVGAWGERWVRWARRC